MSDQKRLFLVDAYALIFRGYYAFIKNPRINSKGTDTSAILGFMNSLLDVIKRERPDHLAVCFDKGGSVARNEMFEEYKANRDATPEAIKVAVPYIYDILKAMHIPIMVKEGYEADDVIGTLAKKAEKEGYKTFMVTPDKDFAQLVSENIFMYRPMFGGGYETWGIPEVQKKFEVESPLQVIDFLGMMGDSADNIPGLPGVGEKTAKKFIAAYGSMEGLLANTHELKGKMKEKVEGAKELGMLSKELAKIILDVPVEFDAKDFEMSEPNIESVMTIFQELEFRRLIDNFNKTFSAEAANPVSNSIETKAVPKKQTSAGEGQFSLFGGDIATAEEKTATPSGRKTIATTEHLYQSIAPGMAMKLFVSNLMKQKSVCFDTETTGLNPITAELVGIAFSWEVGKGFYVPFPEDKDEAQKGIEQLRPFFEDAGIEKIGQNLKYDIKVLKKYNLDVQGKLFDTMLAHYLINPDMRHNMDVLAETYLNYSPVSITELIGKKGKNQLSMRQVPLEQQTEYAVEDTDITLQLKEHFQKELGEANTQTLFDEIEIPLVRVLADMELEGINLDAAFLNSLSEDLNRDIAILETKIYEQAGEQFNIASPKQLGEILFDKMKLVDKPKKTKTGQYSTAEDVLSYLAKDHEIIQNILEYRGLAKLKNTYVDALPAQVEPITGRVHTDYMQTVAATGRLASNNPNLQNIPIRTERGRQVRKAFIPRNEDYTLLAADYSQIELRIIAALSEEDNMIDAFKNGEDIHASTAAKVFNIPIDQVTREQRGNAKTVNFGIIYGVSAFGLSNQTDLNRTEAKELIDTYYKTYPKLRKYMSEQVDFARDNGYVQTVLGRRRYLKNINSQNAVVRGASERNAVNAPIQGSAADIIKIAMINVHKKLEEGAYKSKMLLQVHDELVFDVYKPELETMKSLIKSEMENAYKLSVPLDVDLDIGDNWLEALYFFIHKTSYMKNLDRRDFLRKTALSGAAIAISPILNSCAETVEQVPESGGTYMGGFAAPKIENIRMAFIGVGARGGYHMQFSALLENTEVVAISDLYEDNVRKWATKATEIGAGTRHKDVAVYYGDENKWQDMLEEVKPDVVFIATNWKNHAPMAIEAMKKGAHVFVEVPIAVTIEEMWDIVNTSERTQKHCMMMENVNYSRDELMFLNMCRQGVIGELLHAEAAYIHELRWQMEEQERGTGSWRTHHYANRNGNLYPTHGLGPVAQYMNIGRTDDTFNTMVSFSTPAIGRKAYAEKNYAADHKWNQLDFKGGDMNTSIIKTHLGRTIMVQWDETSPRPYTRHNLIQGTKGILAGFPTRAAFEGGFEDITENHHRWVQGEQLAALYEKYDHPLYKRLNEKTKESGHGGMDGMMVYRIIECLHKGLPLDQNVYEGCLWSAVSPLSETSVANGGAPQAFPDFTRGNWNTTEPLDIIS